MNKVAFVTLGCKTNQYETDALMDLFYKNRYEIVDFEDFSDIYVINTCTVTHVSDKKSRQMIRRAKKNNPNGIVVVVGCYAQISPDEVKAIEGVDIVIGTDARSDMLHYIADYQSGETEKPYVIVKDIMKVSHFEEMTLGAVTAHTRAFIKIQEGCNQYCSYCIIPYARGHVRSRSIEHVLSEVQQLTLRGYKEFVLTGIHIGSYGLDLENVTLIDLIEAIHTVEGVKRIRLGSVEPRLITDAFVQRLKPLNKVCDHFHLSLQSGSNSVLKRMNRKYTSEAFYQSVIKLREIYDAPSLTTDIIVGFPGETEAEFEDTYAFVKKIAFSEIHVFPFSKREGTPAAEMEQQVDPNVKKQRSERLIALGKEMNDVYVHSFESQIATVLIEERKGSECIGHSSNYLKVHIVDSDHSLKQGEIYSVLIKETNNHKITGEIVK